MTDALEDQIVGGRFRAARDLDDHFVDDAKCDIGDGNGNRHRERG